MRELDRLELYRARSRLYRSQFLQVNTRSTALDEIFKIYISLRPSDLKIQPTFFQTSVQRFANLNEMFAKFAILVAFFQMRCFLRRIF